MPHLLNDPAYVKEQYRDPANLDARIALHARFSTARRDFHEWVFDHFNLREHARVLELGCGTGALWTKNRARIPLSWQLILSDFSFGMIQTARAANLPARFAEFDAQTIPFRDESFDAAVADHMLYHIPDLPRALGEIRRTLNRDGKLYAATNGLTHMREYFKLAADFLGIEPIVPFAQFTLENGAEQLGKYFASVEQFDFEDNLVVTEVEPLVAYARSGFIGKELIGREREKELREIVAKRIARDGAIRITKAVGLLVASKEPCHAERSEPKP